jgi:hypothetical protein
MLAGKPSHGYIDSSQIESLGGEKADESNAPTAIPVAPHFEDAPVGPGVLEARFLAEPFEPAVQLRLYDQFLAASGLGKTQFSVMDRTTLGRNILPLET